MKRKVGDEGYSQSRKKRVHPITHNSNGKARAAQDECGGIDAEKLQSQTRRSQSQQQNAMRNKRKSSGITPDEVAAFVSRLDPNANKPSPFPFDMMQAQQQQQQQAAAAMPKAPSFARSQSQSISMPGFIRQQSRPIVSPMEAPHLPGLARQQSKSVHSTESTQSTVSRPSSIGLSRQQSNIVKATALDRQQSTSHSFAAKRPQQQQQEQEESVGMIGLVRQRSSRTPTQLELEAQHSRQVTEFMRKRSREYTPPTPSRLSTMPVNNVVNGFQQHQLRQPTESELERNHSWIFSSRIWIVFLSLFVLFTAALVPNNNSKGNRRLTKSLFGMQLPVPQTTIKESLWFISKPVLPLFSQSVVSPDITVPTDRTLRDFVMDPRGIHLAIAPSFFGFFAYFGALQAWDQELSLDNNNTSVLKTQIRSVAGSSAGAMTAVLLASEISPQAAAEFCKTVTLGKFADFPGFMAAFKGDLFEHLMQSFLEKQAPQSSWQLQDAPIPVAVTGFDVKSRRTKILTRGNMAKASRASASFPLLFQPTKWVDPPHGSTSYLIDGGIEDYLGIMGLSAHNKTMPKRIVNLVVGTFGVDGPLGPSSMPKGVEASEVVSISIVNAPRCGPWAMKNGPKAVEAARQVMAANLDTPLHRGKEKGHYILVIDASQIADD